MNVTEIRYTFIFNLTHTHIQVSILYFCFVFGIMRRINSWRHGLGFTLAASAGKAGSGNITISGHFVPFLVVYYRINDKKWQNDDRVVLLPRSSHVTFRYVTARELHLFYNILFLAGLLLVVCVLLFVRWRHVSTHVLCDVAGLCFVGEMRALVFVCFWVYCATLRAV